MKVAEQNNPTNIDSLFDGGETTEHKNDRIRYPVNDSYDFVANDATDITDANTIYAMCELGRIDKLLCFQTMLDYVTNAGGIGSLPVDEQATATAILSPTADDIDAMRGVRDRRISTAGALLYSELARADLDDIMNDIIDTGLTEKYKDSGRHGTGKGHAEGVSDYVQGVAGTTWDGAGLVNKGFTPSTYPSMQALADAVEAILEGSV